MIIVRIGRPRHIVTGRVTSLDRDLYCYQISNINYNKYIGNYNIINVYTHIISE